MLLPVIDGLEIVPVRLINFISAKHIRPQRLAAILAYIQRPDGFPLTPYHFDVERDGEIVKSVSTDILGRAPNGLEINAYYIDNSGTTQKMLHTEWLDIHKNISALEQKYRNIERKTGVVDVEFPAWELEAIKTIPSGVFLWKNDLNALWEAYLELISPTHRRGCLPDAYMMNYNAFIPAEYHELVLKGFEHLQKNILGSSSCESKITMEQKPVDISYEEITEDLIQNESYDLQSKRNKGGRHKSPLSEAIEFVYKKYLSEGNTEILRSGKIREFLQRLKELADEKSNQDFSTYVADRIESVKMFKSGCTVTTKEQIIKCSERRDRVEKSSDYNQQEVSKQLTELRKKFPLKM